MVDSDLGCSVIVPTCDRPSGLARCLKALAQQIPPTRGYEVIVVDDGGRRPAGLVVAAIARETNVNVRHHRQDNAGPATARNTGAALARGRRLVFTDDDCAPEPGWLAALVRAADQQPDAMLGGVSINACQANLFSEASQLLIDFLQQPGADAGPSFLASNNLCVSAARFHEVGGFDPRFPRAAGEDRDLCDRWRARGWPIAQVVEARLEHHHRLGPRSFWRQHVNYGRGAYRVRTLRRHRDKSSGSSHARTRLGFYVALVAYPLRRGIRPRRWVESGLLGIAQAATAMGFFEERAGSSLNPPVVCDDESNRGPTQSTSPDDEGSNAKAGD